MRIVAKYWKSLYTNEIYRMDPDWEPKFGGWELVGIAEEYLL